MSNHWIYIEPFVYINIKGDYAILYNTLNFKSLIVSNKKIIAILKKINENDNLRVTRLLSLNAKEPEIKKFISNIKKFYFGDILPSLNSKLKPIQFIPLTNVKYDIKKLQTNFSSIAGEYISNNLHELDIYINSTYESEFQFLEYAYRQFPVNYIDNNLKEMDFVDFERIIEMSKQTAINKINIFGGNIFLHSSITKISNCLETSLIIKEYNFFIDDFLNSSFIPALSKGSNILNVWLYYPYKWNESNFSILESSGYKVQYQFIVDNLKQFNYYLKVIDEQSLESVYFNPIFTNKNHNFFSKIFL